MNLKRKFKSIGQSCKIDSRSIFFNSQRIALGNNCTIKAYASLDASKGEQDYIFLGDNCKVGEFSIIDTYGGYIEIGSDCSINSHSVIYGHGGLKIGNFVRIATHTIIIPSNHVFSNRNKRIMDQGLNNKGIQIDDDVWIGAGVTITDGVRIGQGSVIGAGSVVTKDIPPFQVWAGVPAKYLKDR